MAKSKSARSSQNGEAADPVEQSVVAFAEQLGRLVGTVQGRAEGWMDRTALTGQIASVRDGASALLAKLSAGRISAPAKQPAKPSVAARAIGRSGGVVDAPGKKHRKPVVMAAPGNIAKAQAAKVRAAKPMAKTKRTRGRG